MHYYALVGTAVGKGKDIIDGVPYCAYHNGGPGDTEPGKGQRLVFVHPGTGQTLHVLLLEGPRDVTLPAPSSGTGGLWDVWLMVADDYDQPYGQSWVGRAKKHLEQNTDSADVFGPFSLAEALRRWPVGVTELLQDGSGNWAFPIIDGDQGIMDQLVLVDSDQDGEPVFPGGE